MEILTGTIAMAKRTMGGASALVCLTILRPPYANSRQYTPVKCPVLQFHGLNDTALLPGMLNDTWKWLELLPRPWCAGWRSSEEEGTCGKASWL
jgi:hypothetical protein